MTALKRITWDEAAIDRLSRDVPRFDITPCPLDMVDQGLHTWMIVDAAVSQDGSLLSFAVVDCDRKGGR